jgi:hypothetical protein
MAKENKDKLIYMYIYFFKFHPSNCLQAENISDGVLPYYSRKWKILGGIHVENG